MFHAEEHVFCFVMYIFMHSMFIYSFKPLKDLTMEVIKMLIHVSQNEVTREIPDSYLKAVATADICVYEKG